MNWKLKAGIIICVRKKERKKESDVSNDNVQLHQIMRAGGRNIAS